MLDGGKIGYVSAKVVVTNQMAANEERRDIPNTLSRTLELAIPNERYVRLMPGQTYALSMSMPQGAGLQADLGKWSVQWYSDNPTVATFDNSGIIHAHAVGETLIMAIVNGNVEDARQKGACLVRVTENMPVTRALLIGVDDYSRAPWALGASDLPGSIANVRTFRDLLYAQCTNVGLIEPLANPTAEEARQALVSGHN